MKDWPPAGGSVLTLECKTPETGVDLVASIGYKYNQKKVLCFVMTKNAGSTKSGDNPYRARFPDEFGNLKERILVDRPEATIGHYFKFADLIYSHNNNRQFRLALEQLWLTINAWFRCFVSSLSEFFYKEE